ncbi:MAG: NUDIX hydrolase [Candidatus Bathyarchaeia archaeon]
MSMRREYPERPIAGVAAVIFRGNEVLLTRRRNPPGEGLWGLPGGVVELGETVREAIVREVREECGIEVEPIKLLEVYDSIVRDEEGRVRFHYILSEFLCKVVGGSLKPSSDALEAGWIPLVKLEELPIGRGTLRFIMRTAAEERISPET